MPLGAFKLTGHVICPALLPNSEQACVYIYYFQGGVHRGIQRWRRCASQLGQALSKEIKSLSKDEIRINCRVLLLLLLFIISFLNEIFNF